MKVEYVDGCVLCGVRKDKHRYATCGEEVEEAKLDLVSNMTAQNHIWYEMKIVHGYYGKGIPEIFKSLGEQ